VHFRVSNDQILYVLKQLVCLIDVFVAYHLTYIFTYQVTVIPWLPLSIQIFGAAAMLVPSISLND